MNKIHKFMLSLPMGVIVYVYIISFVMSLEKLPIHRRDNILIFASITVVCSLIILIADKKLYFNDNIVGNVNIKIDGKLEALKFLEVWFLMISPCFVFNDISMFNLIVIILLLLIILLTTAKYELFIYNPYFLLKYYIYKVTDVDGNEYILLSKMKIYEIETTLNSCIPIVRAKWSPRSNIILHKNDNIKKKK